MVATRRVRLPVLSRDDGRPRTRRECELPRGIRPCPYISCRFHLVDVIEHERAGIEINDRTLRYDAREDEIEAFTDSIAESLVTRKQSCVLDVVDRPDLRKAKHNDLAATLEEVGDVFNLTRERIRQIEARSAPALRKALRARKVSLR